MKFAKNKTMATMIAIFLMLTITATLIALPTVNAAVNYYHTLVFAGVSPAVVGVGQQALFIWWTAEIPLDIGEQSGAVPSPSGRAGWAGVTLTVTKPDNTTEDLQMGWSDPVGGGYVAYTPEVVGTYYVQANFPATWKNTTANQRLYTSAVSEKAALTVQQEPVPYYQETPLPTDYWTRPIYGANRDWWQVAANWLGGAAQVWPIGAAGGTTNSFAYGEGPESAHVLWTRPYWSGGIMDARTGTISYYTGLSYESFGGPNIILEGKVYYTVQAVPRQGFYCVDLYSGETIYFRNTTGPVVLESRDTAIIPYGKYAFGQIYNYESPNQHGGLPYLWVTDTGVTNQWDMYDGFTGNWITSIANVTSAGTAAYGKDGSILRYNTVNLGTTAAPNYYLQLWNSSAIPSLRPAETGTSAWQWRPPRRTVHDGNKGFSLNVSIPSILGPRNALLNQTGTIQAVREDEYVIVGTAGRNDERGNVPGYLMAFSLEPGRQGTRLWETTFTPPAAFTYLNVSVSMSGVYPEYGVFLFDSADLRQRWGYNMSTGALLWESEPESQWNYYGMSENVYQGKLFTYGYGGILIAYNITTGDIVWTWSAPFEGLGESWYTYSPLSLACIADGKIYMYTSEHSATQPLRRDANIWSIDTETGELIWKMSCWAAAPKIADGRLVVLNLFDNAIYCFGKGPSATTVTASPKVSVHGSSVLIEGTVTDQTPSGRLNTNLGLDFTLKGTPAISDEDMEAWMEYLYQQRPIPANAKGVEVVLTVLDPNNNVYEVGRTTSDITGTFGYEFEPEVPGTYQIIATFAGSNAYGPSFGTTYLAVGNEAPTTPAPTQTPPSMADLYFVPATIGIIIAVIAIGLVIILMLRKRP